MESIEYITVHSGSGHREKPCKTRKGTWTNVSGNLILTNAVNNLILTKAVNATDHKH